MMIPISIWDILLILPAMFWHITLPIAAILTLIGWIAQAAWLKWTAFTLAAILAADCLFAYLVFGP